MIINPSSISFSKIREDFLRWLSDRPDMARWKDYYVSSTGTVLLELLAGHLTFQQYQLTASKREAYLQYAQTRGAVIAGGERLGYSAFRGTNTHAALTISNPTSTRTLSKFEVIGTVKDQYIYASETTSITAGASTVINTVLGTLKSESLTIPSEQTYMHRFISPNMSSDISLKLNNCTLLYSDQILNILKGYFVVLTNANGGIDVFSVNAARPKSIQASLKTSGGTMGDGTYKYVITAMRSVPDTSAQETLASEEVSAVISNGNSNNSILLLWSYPGADYYKIYDGRTITNNEYTQYWISYTTSFTDTGAGGTIAGAPPTSNPYFYTTADKLVVDYIELKNFTYSNSDLSFYYGTINSVATTPYITEEAIADIKINAPLHHEAQYVIRGREDYAKLFKSLPAEEYGIFLSDTSYVDVSSAVVKLCYVQNNLKKLTASQKSNILGKLYGYRPLGLEPPTIGDPTGNGLKLRIALALSDTTVTNVQIDTDIAAVLAAYEKTLGLSFNIRDLEKDLEALAYVKVARVVIDVLDVRTRTNTAAYYPNQRVKFVAGNMAGYYARCITSGVSGNSEPSVTTPAIGLQVTDNLATWQLEKLNEYPWQTLKVYALNDVVIPSIATGLYYKCTANGTSAATEPSWPTTINNTVVDGTVTWTCIQNINPSGVQIGWDEYLTSYNTVPRVNSTVYALNATVTPVTNETGYVYLCGTTGTTASSEPSIWTTTIGGTVIDGSVIWTCTDTKIRYTYTRQ